jgi:hypothetical protein
VLELWSTRHGIKVSFEARDIQASGAIIPAICVCFKASVEHTRKRIKDHHRKIAHTFPRP